MAWGDWAAAPTLSTSLGSGTSAPAATGGTGGWGSWGAGNPSTATQPQSHSNGWFGSLTDPLGIVSATKGLVSGMATGFGKVIVNTGQALGEAARGDFSNAGASLGKAGQGVGDFGAGFGTAAESFASTLALPFGGTNGLTSVLQHDVFQPFNKYLSQSNFISPEMQTTLAAGGKGLSPADFITSAEHGGIGGAVIQTAAQAAMVVAPFEGVPAALADNAAGAAAAAEDAGAAAQAASYAAKAAKWEKISTAAELTAHPMANGSDLIGGKLQETGGDWQTKLGTAIMKAGHPFQTAGMATTDLLSAARDKMFPADVQHPTSEGYNPFAPATNVTPESMAAAQTAVVPPEVLAAFRDQLHPTVAASEGMAQANEAAYGPSPELKAALTAAEQHVAAQPTPPIADHAPPEPGMTRLYNGGDNGRQLWTSDPARAESYRRSFTTQIDNGVRHIDVPTEVADKLLANPDTNPEVYAKATGAADGLPNPATDYYLGDHPDLMKNAVEHGQLPTTTEAGHPAVSQVEPTKYDVSKGKIMSPDEKIAADAQLRDATASARENVNPPLYVFDQLGARLAMPTPAWATWITDHLPDSINRLLGRTGANAITAMRFRNLYQNAMQAMVTAQRMARTSDMMVASEDAARLLLSPTLGRDIAEARVGEELHARINGEALVGEWFKNRGGFTNDQAFKLRQAARSGYEGVTNEMLSKLSPEQKAAFEQHMEEAINAYRTEASKALETLMASRYGAKGLEAALLGPNDVPMTPEQMRLYRRSERDLRFAEKARERVPAEQERAAANAAKAEAVGANRWGYVDSLRAKLGLTLQTAEDLYRGIPKGLAGDGAQLIADTMRTLTDEGGALMDVATGQATHPTAGIYIPLAQQFDIPLESWATDGAAAVKDALLNPKDNNGGVYNPQRLYGGQDARLAVNITPGADGSMRVIGTLAQHTLNGDPILPWQASIIGAAHEAPGGFDFATNNATPFTADPNEQALMMHYVGDVLNPKSDLSRWANDRATVAAKVGISPDALNHEIASQLWLDRIMTQRPGGMWKQGDIFKSELAYGQNKPTLDYLAQTIMDDRSLNAHVDTAMHAADAAGVNKMLQWYYDSHAFIENLYRGKTMPVTGRDAAETFYDVLALSSVMASPTQNLGRALAGFANLDDFLSARKGAMKDAQAVIDQALGGKMPNDVVYVKGLGTDEEKLVARGQGGTAVSRRWLDSAAGRELSAQTSMTTQPKYRIIDALTGRFNLETATAADIGGQPEWWTGKPTNYSDEKLAPQAVMHHAELLGITSPELTAYRDWAVAHERISAANEVRQAAGKDYVNPITDIHDVQRQRAQADVAPDVATLTAAHPEFAQLNQILQDPDVGLNLAQRVNHVITNDVYHDIPDFRTLMNDNGTPTREFYDPALRQQVRDALQAKADAWYGRNKSGQERAAGEIPNEKHLAYSGLINAYDQWTQLVLDNSRGILGGRQVHAQEYQNLTHDGRAYAERAMANSSPHVLADPAVRDAAYAAVQQGEWSGSTIDAHTGQPIPSDYKGDTFAVTARIGTKTEVTVPVDATKAVFDRAYAKALKLYDNVLSSEGGHLGVFRNEDTGRIEIDPVYHTQNVHDAEAVGAYAHSNGGAYNFATGNGYWVPHVPNDEAWSSMASAKKDIATSAAKGTALSKTGALRPAYENALMEYHGSSLLAKLRSFRDNLAHPHESLAVTLDSIMAQLFGFDKTHWGLKGEYAKYADMIRQNAEQWSQVAGRQVMPHEIQALLWVYAKRAIGEQDWGRLQAHADFAHTGIGMLEDAVKNGRQIKVDPNFDLFGDWWKQELQFSRDQLSVRTERKLLRTERTAGTISPADLQRLQYLESVPTRQETSVEVMNKDGKVEYQPRHETSYDAKQLSHREEQYVEYLKTVAIPLRKAIAEGNFDTARSLVDEFVTGRKKSILGVVEGAEFGPKMLQDPNGVGAQSIARLQNAKYVPSPNPEALNTSELFSKFGDKTRGVTLANPNKFGRIMQRLYSTADVSTLLHEDLHAFRLHAPGNDVAGFEQAYPGIQDATLTPARVKAEEQFVTDFMGYLRSRSAGGTYNGPLAPLFNEVAKTMEAHYGPALNTESGAAVAPEIVKYWDSIFNRDIVAPPAMADPLSNQYVPENKGVNTVQSRGESDAAFAQRTRQYGEARGQAEVLQQRVQDAAALARKADTFANQMRGLMGEPTRHEIIASKLEDRANRTLGKIADQLKSPEGNQVPRAWRPYMDAIDRITAEAKKDPSLAPLLDEIPTNFENALRYAAQQGFDPAYIPHLTFDQAQKYLLGHLQLGTSALEAGTRKENQGVLDSRGLTDRSMQALGSGTVIAMKELLQSRLIQFVEDNYARQWDPGTPIPEGWKAWAPARDAIITGRNIDNKLVAVNADKIIPEGVHSTLRAFQKPPVDLPFRFLWKGAPMQVWKHLLLTFSPTWYIKHFIGAVTLATLEGVRPADWKVAWDQWKTKTLPNEVTGRNLYATIDSELGISKQIVPGWKDIPDIMRSEGVRVAAHEITQKLHQVVSTTDAVSRAAVYARTLRTGGSVELAATRAYEALGDFGRLGPVERSMVTQIIPFYAFQKAMFRILLRMPVDHPLATGILMQLGTMHEAYMKDKLGGALPDNFLGSSFINGQLMKLDKLNPLVDSYKLTTLDGIAGSANPFIRLLAQQALHSPTYGSVAGMDANGNLIQTPDLGQTISGFYTGAIPGVGKPLDAGLATVTPTLSDAQYQKLLKRIAKAGKAEQTVANGGYLVTDAYKPAAQAAPKTGWGSWGG